MHDVTNTKKKPVVLMLVLPLLVSAAAAVTLAVATAFRLWLHWSRAPHDADPTVALELEAAGGCSVGLVLSLSEVAVLVV